MLAGRFVRTPLLTLKLDLLVVFESALLGADQVEARALQRARCASRATPSACPARRRIGGRENSPTGGRNHTSTRTTAGTGPRVN